MSTDGYTYLASPYSHDSEFVREQRYLVAKAATTWLLRNKVWVYSPIVHCHDLAKTSDMPRDAGFWQQYNFVMLDDAVSIIILQIEGWEKSKGLQGEAWRAFRRRKPFFLIWPQNEGLRDFHYNEWQFPKVWQGDANS